MNDIAEEIGEENGKNGRGNADNAADAPENCTVYRKNDEDDFFFAGVSKKSCGGKKSAKKQKVAFFKINTHNFFKRAVLRRPEI